MWLYRLTTEINFACLVHQSLALLAPTYLTTDIHLVSEYGRRPLRSSTDRTLTVPRTHKRFGDRSFAVAGPRLWNSLPIRLRQISSYGQFRRSVTYLMSQFRMSFVCLLSVTFMRPTQAVEIFGNASTPFCSLAIQWASCEILPRLSQGNPSNGG